MWTVYIKMKFPLALSCMECVFFSLPLSFRRHRRLRRCFVHFSHSLTRKECVFIVFINHTHDTNCIRWDRVFLFLFSNALLAIDQNSPKTKLIRIVCEYEKHNRSGPFNYLCIFRNVRTMYK